MASLARANIIIRSFTLILPCVSALKSASISAGTVQGANCRTSSATSFQSIPYALPPTGYLRFEPPRAWNGIFPNGSLDAITPTPNCPQFVSDFVEPGPQSEDCLFVNVWVPTNAIATSKLPVKVWIYGGGDDGGSISGPLYNGCNLAEIGNTLVVSINYRLGPLGFLALESAGVSGNFGIQDILLGLQWIQDNIAAFGGDPKRVLLFGQSAGAGNVYVVSTLPQATSLFSAAITESGGGRDILLNNSVQNQGANYTRSIGCSVTDLGCLQSKSLSDLNTTLGGKIMNAYVDEKVIPNQPSQVGTNVPMILGSNSKDSAILELGQYGKPTNVTAADYTSLLQTSFGPAASLVAQKYPLSLFNNTPHPAYYAYEVVETDSAYKCPAYRGLALAFQKGIPVWTYLFNHTLSCPWIPSVPDSQKALQFLGPTHTMELPLVFGNVDGLPLPNGNCSLTSAEKQISDTLIAAWASMAASVDPAPSEGLQWPRWDPQSSQGLVINNSSAVGLVDYSVCAFWDMIDAIVLNASESANNASSSASTQNATNGNLSTPSSTPFTGGATVTSSMVVWMRSLGGAAVAMIVVIALL